MMFEVLLTRSERRERIQAFHAEIARKASLVERRDNSRTYFVPNTPFGVKKIGTKPIPPAPRNIEPDYWHHMWFFDLVFMTAKIPPAQLKVESIISAVEKEFGVSRADILSIRREAKVVLPRQIVAYLAKTLTTRSLPDIGRRLGGKDHTTILHAVRKISARVQNDCELAARIERIKATL